MPDPPGGASPASIVYAELESALRDRDFLVGELSIADFALFPHLASVRFLGVGFERDAHPALSAWLERMRALPILVVPARASPGHPASLGSASLRARFRALAGSRVPDPGSTRFAWLRLGLRSGV